MHISIRGEHEVDGLDRERARESFPTVLPNWLPDQINFVCQVDWNRRIGGDS